MKSFTPLLAIAAVACAQQQAKPNADECAQASIVAMLIQANIADQQEELKAVNAVGEALAKNDQAAFGEARNQLLTVVNNGIAIRQTAQQISPKNFAAAAAGLETVKNAQIGELNLAMNLTGNPATDNAIVDQLKKNFAGGMEQNKKNAIAATNGCGAAAGAANGKANGKNNGQNNNNNNNAAGANKPAAGADANKPAAGADANKGAAAGAKPAAGAEANKGAAAGAEANKGAADPAKAKKEAAGAKPAAGAEANKAAADPAKAKPAAAQPAKEDEEDEDHSEQKRAVRHARDFGL